MTSQLNLFESVTQAYAKAERLDNAALYAQVAPANAQNARQPVGKDGVTRNVVHRSIRWHQQTLKSMGLLERVDRGVWQLTDEGRQQLRKIEPGYVMLAFSTRLGVALWADCRTAFDRVDEPITLCLTSPPYPLANPRAYGNPSEAEFVDFLCAAIEPIVERLEPQGSLVLNLSNDVFLKGSPARSLYRERLVLALADRFDLAKMDELIWHNKSKPPGPMQWASKTRQQLNVGWEPIYWFAKDPERVKADNRRVLEPHSERQQKLIAAGGENRDAAYSDGAYRVRPSAYGRPTAGRIPKNVLEMGHACASQRAYKKMARAAGLPAHGAPFPARLAEFFIRFLSVEGDLVVDPFGGSMTVPLAAEMLGRHWIATDVIWEYLAGGGMRFGEDKAAWNPDFQSVA